MVVVSGTSTPCACTMVKWEGTNTFVEDWNGSAWTETTDLTQDKIILGVLGHNKLHYVLVVKLVLQQSTNETLE